MAGLQTIQTFSSQFITHLLFPPFEYHFPPLLPLFFPSPGDRSSPVKALHRPGTGRRRPFLFLGPIPVPCDGPPTRHSTFFKGSIAHLCRISE